MKRDMNLIREILLYIEENFNGDYLKTIKGLDCDYQTLIYHLKLLDEARLIDDFRPIDADVYRTVGFIVGGLSWDGQDYLELIRNDEIWEKTVAEVEEKKLPKTIEYIAKIAGKFTGALISELNG